MGRMYALFVSEIYIYLSENFLQSSIKYVKLVYSICSVVFVMQPVAKFNFSDVEVT